MLAVSLSNLRAGELGLRAQGTNGRLPEASRPPQSQLGSCSCVSQGKLLDFSEPVFPSLQAGGLSEG